MFYASTNDLLLSICSPEDFSAENNKVRYDVIVLRAQYGTITGSNVELRKDPGLSSTILAYMEKGAIVTVMNENSVVKDEYTWRKIVYNNTTGWVASTYLAEEMG